MSIDLLKVLLQKANISSEYANEILKLFRDAVLDISDLKTLFHADELEQETADEHLGDEEWTTDVPKDESRYKILELLGEGGMGRVYRVRDNLLHRIVAMKKIHPELITHKSLLFRFMEEAQVIAQLQHPNIIPIYDFGETQNGGFYYTMIEVNGFRLDELIATVHKHVTQLTYHVTEDGWSFHRLMSVFLRICEAVAFAHEKGVLHRDLKPSNVMIGSFGAVFVLDWGIAKIIGSDENTVIDSERSANPQFSTHIGQVTGTPAYMSPEQAQGENNRLDSRSDVYSLGAILHEILFGIPPYIGDQILEKVRSNQPTIIQRFSSPRLDRTVQFPKRLDQIPSLPIELIEACRKALYRKPEGRFSNASLLAAVIREWLDGSQKQEKALRIVEEAFMKDEEVVGLHKQAELLKKQSREMLNEVKPWESELKKHEAWEKEDNAKNLLEEAELLLSKREQLLQAALTHKGNLLEAHLALAKFYREQHEEQESPIVQKKIGLRLMQHAKALPLHSHDRIQHFAYLKGQGAISLDTNPSSAEVWIQPYHEKNRRLIPGDSFFLGTTPLVKEALDMGSYRLMIRKKGYEDVVYPVFIQRQEHWTSIPFEHSDFEPIWLPKKGYLSPEEHYIPAGWFWSGGDSSLSTSLPRQRVWVPAMVFRRYPVRNKEYVTFLNSLRSQGKFDLATECAPKERATSSLLFSIEAGLFICSDNQAELPVHSIDWHSCNRYIEWYSNESNNQWLLPTEFTWEKAARGVDGRFFPWGNQFDPSWACMKDSHVGPKVVAPVDSYPIDESPYGIRGMGGNIMEWTASVFDKEGQVLENGHPLLSKKVITEDTEVLYKGGCWYFGERFLRSSDRHSISSQHRGNLIGFRMMRMLSTK